MNKPTISIDLGASYTKVAYRRSLQRERGKGFATAETRIVVPEEGVVTISSLMIQTNHSRLPWCAGQAALNMTPGADMQVFSNWKEPFFTCATGRKKDEAILAAGQFFKWLLARLKQLTMVCDDSCRIRVSVPALEGIAKQKKQLVQCMVGNGWPDVIETVPEPVSNLLGVLSGGRNVVSAYGQISYKPTFGNQGETPPDLNHVFTEMWQCARGFRTRQEMRVTVIDFGSFTLDVAVLLLDLGIQDHDKFPVEKIIPVSFEIGVTSGIDRPCFSALFDRHDVNGGLLKQYEKEDAKVELYAGRSYALDSGIILGDTDQDKKTVGSAIDSYCRSVWEHIAPRCHDSEVVILTGGGSCIPYVRDFIHSRLQKRGVKHIVDFGDTGYCDLGVGIHKWRRSGISLGRLGSALGGASIGFGFEPDEGFGRGYIPGR